MKKTKVFILFLSFLSFFSCSDNEDNASTSNEYVLYSKHEMEFAYTVPITLKFLSNSTTVSYDVYSCEKCGFSYSADDISTIVQNACLSIGYSRARAAMISAHYAARAEFVMYLNRNHPCHINSFIYKHPGYTKFHEMHYEKKTYTIYQSKGDVTIGYYISKCKFCNLKYTTWTEQFFIDKIYSTLMSELGYKYEQAKRIAEQEVKKEPLVTLIKNFSENNQPTCTEHQRMTKYNYED